MVEEEARERKIHLFHSFGDVILDRKKTIPHVSGFPSRNIGGDRSSSADGELIR
jgi:hypothetical protein